VLRARDSALEGESTAAFLRQFKVDIGIQTTLGIDPDGSLRDRDTREGPVSQVLMAQSKLNWLVADMSKFNQTALAEVGHLKDMDRVFTEALPPAPFAQLMQDWGVSLTIAY